MPTKTADPVPLTTEQRAIRDRLQRNLREILDKIYSDQRLPAQAVDDLGDLATTLHKSLTASGVKVRHHKQMIKNRGMEPDAPGFYRHVHPVEDLLKFVDDQSANNDPEDRTLDHEFTFDLFSRRWGHNDTYRVKRTKGGWEFSRAQTLPTGRDGRVGGKPGTGLFNLLDHESINYPEDLPGYLAWLWKKAASDGLSQDQVQEALTALANWIILVERHTPKGIFESFK